MATEEAGNGFNIHPMDQFEITNLFGDGAIHWYSITNATLWMGIAIVAVILLLVVGTSSRATVPTRTQSIAEMMYGFVYKMIEDVAGKITATPSSLSQRYIS